MKGPKTAKTGERNTKTGRFSAGEHLEEGKGLQQRYLQPIELKIFEFK